MTSERNKKCISAVPNTRESFITPHLSSAPRRIVAGLCIRTLRSARPRHLTQFLPNLAGISDVAFQLESPTYSVQSLSATVIKRLPGEAVIAQNMRGTICILLRVRPWPPAMKSALSQCSIYTAVGAIRSARSQWHRQVEVNLLILFYFRGLKLHLHAWGHREHRPVLQSIASKAVLRVNSAECKDKLHVFS